jgi:micrococcal nuclease
MNRKKYRIVIALAVLTFALFSLGHELSLARPAMHEAQVIEVNDGDTVTIRLDSETYRTRLAGIDAPEMGQRPWGRKAKEHLIGIMRDSGWMVFVETDIVKHDKYDRLLAYLWTKQNKLINERMVRDGYAVLFTLSPNVKYADRLSQAESRARNEMKGIWGPKGPGENPLKYRERHPRKEYGF